MNPICVLPPFVEDIGYLRRTNDVLVTDGKEWWIAYFQRWDEGDQEWKQKGRDGYTLDANLIGWMELPVDELKKFR